MRIVPHLVTFCLVVYRVWNGSNAAGCGAVRHGKLTRSRTFKSHKKAIALNKIKMSEFESYVFSANTFVIKRSHHSEAPVETNISVNHGSIEGFHEDPKELKSKSRLLQWLYWEPSQDSWLHEFFGSSVIHGIFWAGAFIASLYFSWSMIKVVLDRYLESPVIVTFNPMEEETKHFPFPAVTMCNKGLFSNQKIEELYDEYEKGEDKEATVQKLRLLNALCSSQRSFLRRMGLVKLEPVDREWKEVLKQPSQDTLDGTVKFIYDVCKKELIRVCSWDNKKRNCSDLFKPIITDYGKCCVFNKIPSELMLFEMDEIRMAEKREQGWSYSDIQEWSKWNYEDGFILDDDTLKFPLRQKRTGNLYELSILVDPDVDNGYCQSHDSLGVRILLHTPADMPRVANLGTGFGLEREIYLKVFPDSTIAIPSLLDFSYEQRKCKFGSASIWKRSNETDITDINRPYTRNNCFMTCLRQRIRNHCNCTLYYARREKGWRICNPSIYSSDNRCVRHIERALASNMKGDCPGCVYGCNYLKYNLEATESALLDPADLWGDNETQLPPPWANKQLSIIHVFMGSDVSVPKLRQKLYSYVDLVASIGGLLGLTLGFSVLLAIEILYLLTLRLCCKRFRNWQIRRKRESTEIFAELQLQMNETL